jgi:hypothetical protein
MIVKMTPEMNRAAVEFAQSQIDAATARNATNSHADTDASRFAVNLVGARGEVAAAAWLGVSWQDSRAPDDGADLIWSGLRIQVKSTRMPDPRYFILGRVDRGLPELNFDIGVLVTPCGQDHAVYTEGGVDLEIYGFIATAQIREHMYEIPFAKAPAWGVSTRYLSAPEDISKIVITGEVTWQSVLTSH